jgi:hypothetical protein
MLTKSEINNPSIFEKTIDSQQDFEKTLDFLANSINLTHLKLVRDNGFRVSRRAMAQLTLIIKQIKKLQVLELFNFYSTDFDLVSTTIINHPTIEQFTFRSMYSVELFRDTSIATLIKSNSKLRSISIGLWQDNGHYFKISASPIFKALEQNTSLTYVDLSNVSFVSCDKAAADIAAMLKINKSLKSLKLTNLFRNDNKAVQTILSALAENQTLLNLHLDSNSSKVNKAVISELEKNTSLICLHLLHHPDPELLDEMENFTEFLSENDIPSKILGRIEQIIKRNIDFKLWSFYQKYLLLTNLALPDDLQKFIFSLMIAKFGIEELTALFTTSSFENGDYLDPPVVEEIKDNKINHFKTIYKALYEGQSSCFKHWNSLVDKEDLTDSNIEEYIKVNPNSRTAEAWQLVDSYTTEQDYKKLFKDVHLYSFANSSNCFGLFKQTHNFSKGYNNLDYQIIQAAEGSRTKTIADIFEANSIKPR